MRDEAPGPLFFFDLLLSKLGESIKNVCLYWTLQTFEQVKASRKHMRPLGVSMKSISAYLTYDFGPITDAGGHSIGCVR